MSGHFKLIQNCQNREVAKCQDVLVLENMVYKSRAHFPQHLLPLAWGSVVFSLFRIGLQGKIQAVGPSSFNAGHCQPTAKTHTDTHMNKPELRSQPHAHAHGARPVQAAQTAQAVWAVQTMKTAQEAQIMQWRRHTQCKWCRRRKSIRRHVHRLRNFVNAMLLLSSVP